MEEKQEMTTEKLERKLSSLRIKAIATIIPCYCCLAVLIYMWFIRHQLFVGLLFGVVALVFFAVSGGYGGQLKKLLSENVIVHVVKDVLGENAEYNPGGRVEPGSIALSSSYNRASGSDYIKAVYNGLNIELSDIELINEVEYEDEDGHTQKRSETCFKGQWLICDFGKELAGDVKVSAIDKKLRKQHKKDAIEMESEAFNNRFLVLANDPLEAYYILTPHMMEYILAMADRSGGDVYLSFQRNGKMHVAVKTGRDFFELGSSKANVEQLRLKFLGELRWFTDIVDTLRVEDSLYQKEASV